jgi:hypothetical protein
MLILSESCRRGVCFRARVAGYSPEGASGNGKGAAEMTEEALALASQPESGVPDDSGVSS